jgi:alpha-L-fucosidase
VKIKSFLVLSLVGVAIAALVVCNIDTASGPTPYTVFNGRTSSSSSVQVDTGAKTFIVQGSLPIFEGRTVTITSAANGSIIMKGVISGYTGQTGALSVHVTQSTGSGNYSDWNLVLGKTPGEIEDSVRQAYSDLKFGMFIHFNMSTFDRNDCGACYSVSGEWGLQNTDEKEFNPTKLDCGQWARTAKSAGCKYMVLTSKHHDGFCLWPSKFTKHCVSSAACTTDVIRAFVDSARAQGLKVGFYYSMRDFSNGHEMDFIEGQLRELLTNYGDIICLWFDGWGWDMGYHIVPYGTIHDFIRSIQPHCLIVENNREMTTVHSDLIEYEIPVTDVPQVGNIHPAEGNEPIRTDNLWFWHPNKQCDLKTAQFIVDRVKLCNARNASYLVDLTPDTTGTIPQCQVDRMKEVGQLRGIGQ